MRICISCKGTFIGSGHTNCTCQKTLCDDVTWDCTPDNYEYHPNWPGHVRQIDEEVLARQVAIHGVAGFTLVT